MAWIHWVLSKVANYWYSEGCSHPLVWVVTIQPWSFWLHRTWSLTTRFEYCLLCFLQESSLSESWREDWRGSHIFDGFASFWCARNSAIAQPSFLTDILPGNYVNFSNISNVLSKLTSCRLPYTRLLYSEYRAQELVIRNNCCGKGWELWITNFPVHFFSKKVI